MTSTIILYVKCEISPEKLFIVDDLPAYLSTLNKTTISKFQYVRQGLKVFIKIDKAESALDFTAANNINYVSIQNDSEKVCYYFVMNKKQIASSTIELELDMDTINTFKLSTDFSLTERTTINREHKDRFETLPKNAEFIKLYGTATTTSVSPAVFRYTYTYTDSSWKGKTLGTIIPINITTNTSNVGYNSYSYDPDTGTIQVIFQASAAYDFSFTINFFLETAARIVRKIDLISEGITPVLYGRNLGEISGGDSNNWYLVYQGTSNIIGLACPENPVTLYVPGTSTINPNDLTAGTYYYLMEDRTSGANRLTCQITSSNNNIYNVAFSSEPGFTANKNRANVVFYAASGKIYIRSLVKTTNPINQWITRYATEWEECTSITLAGTSIISHTLTSYTENLTAIYGGSTYEFIIVGGAYTLNTFSSVSRTASDIVKIIKLPYSPVDISELSPDWSYNSTYGMLQMRNADIRLSSIIEEDTNPLNVLNANITPALIDDKDIQNESKLFHSDYYQPKFIYDSFTKIFALERINTSYYDVLEDTPLYFTFVATNTINSKFLFAFTQYTTENYAFDDFENILYVSRNNEVVIYNSDYLNYIKNGFNYDVKTKNRQEAGQWIGVGLSLVGSVASFASSVVTKGFGIAGGISLATTAMAQLTNAVNSTAQAEATQNQKLLQLRQQKDSTYGADDVDLMSYYCNNKAKLMLYKVSDRMEQILYELFFYTGYIAGYRGIPNVNTRVRFNFLSCEADFKESTISNIPTNILNDIKIKYAAGVTFIHHTDDEWDFEQLYENWETSLF